MKSRFPRASFLAVARRFLAVAWLVCPFAMSARAADDNEYKPVVKIHSLDVPTSEKGKSKAPTTLEITFDVADHIPVGAKIEFQLDYQSLPLATTLYTFRGPEREKQKLTWKPEVTLPIGEGYNLLSRLPLKVTDDDGKEKEVQTGTVMAKIRANPADFPMRSEPWVWYWDQSIYIGDAAAREAEKQKITDIFLKWCEKLIALNGEFVDTCDEVIAGDKFVKNDQLQVEEFAAWLTDWKKRMAKIQEEIANYPQKEPGLYSKTQRLAYEMGYFARMIAKRCHVQKLEETLAKRKVPASRLELEKVENFVDRLPDRREVTVAAMIQRYDIIAALANFPQPEQEESTEGEEGGEEEKKDDADGEQG